MKRFHIASDEEIRQGKVSDVYFHRAVSILKKKGINPVVSAEIVARSFPHGRRWSVFAGAQEALSLLETLPVKVRTIPEGSLFYPDEPVMEIEGKYQDFCIYETALLGMLCQASGIATKAARLKKLAEGRLVVSFGARRMHPAIAPMIERSAFIGGCDGVATVISGELINIDPMGTMPHSLILIFGSTMEALKAYDEIMDEKIPRVALIDTFNDEKFECINVASQLAEKLNAVRLDTPASRRGNFYKLIEEIRWELGFRGLGHVKIFVSGGIDENDIINLNRVVDAYGIGTSISNAPVVDFSMDIVEIEGKPIAKRGKWSGRKRLIECTECGNRKIIPLTNSDGAGEKVQNEKCRCNGTYKDILIPALSSGKYLSTLPSPAEIRRKLLEMLEKEEI